MLYAGLVLNKRYRILNSLRSGGFGHTYLAEDQAMPTRPRCVVKQLTYRHDDETVYQQVAERFFREAAVIESLGKQSDQIPSLFAYFEEDDQLYLVQEWIDGDPFDTFVSPKRRLDEGRVRDLLVSLLAVLDLVHSKGFIHRDIKPGNIILRRADNQPVLIDFGIVKELLKGGAARGTEANSRTIIVGSPGFTAPEQKAGYPVFASDIFSLGMTAISLLTAKGPASLQDPVSGAFRWREHVPDITPHLATILEKSIVPAHTQRFQTAQVMLKALLDMPPPPRSPPPAPPSVEPTAPSRAPAPEVPLAESPDASPPRDTSVQIEASNLLSTVVSHEIVAAVAEALERTRLERTNYSVSVPNGNVVWRNLASVNAGASLVDVARCLSQSLADPTRSRDDRLKAVALLGFAMRTPQLRAAAEGILGVLARYAVPGCRYTDLSVEAMAAAPVPTPKKWEAMFMALDAISENADDVKAVLKALPGVTRPALRAQTATEIVERFFYSPNAAIVQYACEAILEFGCRDVAPALRELLQDGRSNVVHSTARVLVEWRDAPAIPLLREAIDRFRYGTDSHLPYLIGSLIKLEGATACDPFIAEVLKDALSGQQADILNRIASESAAMPHCVATARDLEAAAADEKVRKAAERLVGPPT